MVRDGAASLAEMTPAERSARLAKAEAATLAWGNATLVRARQERLLVVDAQLAEENRASVALEVLYRYNSFVLRWGLGGGGRG